MLWLCLHLPCLPLAVYGPPAATAGLIVGEGGRVLAAGTTARAAGVEVGMSLARARRLHPTALVRPRDAAAEETLLVELARRGGRFTSWVSLSPPWALWLEVGASLALFGGLDRLRRRVEREIRPLGHGGHVAVAPTPLAALWLARGRREGRVTGAARLVDVLAPLPLEVMDLPPRQRSTLQAMGVRDLGGLLRLPRDGLARRFGVGLLEALDRALGRLPHPPARFEPPPYFHRRRPLPAPAVERAALLFPLRRLLEEMAEAARARAAGVGELRLVLHREDGGRSVLRLAADLPTADASLWWLLLRERLERFSLPAPVEGLELRSGPFHALPDAGRDLFTHRSGPAGTGLLARLRARLGRGAVTGVAPAADHRPERAWRPWRPAGEGPRPGVAGSRSTAGARRPLWLLDRPRLLAVVEGRPCWGGPLVLEEEGERIEGGWWDGEDVRRDYFIARNPRGARLWVYRELRPPRRWYLHGFFD